ncbi:MAG: hypothetical protein ABFC78_08140 [Methanoregula sp.]|jgi:hypothetical protein
MARPKTAFFTVLLIIFIAFVFLLWGLQYSDQSPSSENSHVSVPASVIREIDNIRSDERSYFSHWEANASEHLVTVYLNCSIKYDNMKPDMVIEGWTIRRVQDPELYNETSMEAYETFIKNWGKMHPLQKVSYWDADPCTKRVFVALLNSTPEIIRSTEMVDGWRIIFVQAT